MFKLTDRFNDDVIEYKGQKLHVNLAFDVVLRAYELMADKRFNRMEKALIFFDMFIVDHKSYSFSFQDKNIIVKTIFEELLGYKKDEQSSGNKKSYDLTIDAPYIYASFLQDYNIDLFEMQGKLHWHKFLTLLNSLSKDTKLVEVINIREQEVPPPTKHNAKERQRIMELKRIYRLESEEEVVIEADKRMASISEAIKKQALRKKGG
ncbi:Gp15 family bacteriophage protein [Niallia sp. RD1]|uniref:Gp15 family bacteriophage protein n=1 Tax=Niallia sp. RD1 TaxID=2962858 RepID=UPI0020C19307|nr:Gp15 family bacteriophage protein [Niallia sp. RD1]UTI41124.1 bacteriophage Gp15 family protein [Niallia sp. RD1]